MPPGQAAAHAHQRVAGELAGVLAVGEDHPLHRAGARPTGPRSAPGVMTSPMRVRSVRRALVADDPRKPSSGCLGFDSQYESFEFVT